MNKCPNLFSELGISQGAIKEKIEDTFNTMFFDNEEKIYHETEDGKMGYLLDTGNNDARTEGMSYGMMMAVQMDRKDIFDKLWLFSKTYMHQKDGKFEGYFAWSVQPDGTKNSEGPAPDGEEYYALALFFASTRWGDGEAPFDYSVQARDILRHCVHQDNIVKDGSSMWDPVTKYIKFVPGVDYTDPSYHLPHFYEIFAHRANLLDRTFWREAAEASRKYLEICCHPVTGMAPEYAEYDGTPRELSHKQQFYSDSYRVAMNIGLDGAWFGKKENLGNIVDRLQKFFDQYESEDMYHAYMIDGTPVGELALHPIAIVATNAAGSLATDNPNRMAWVQKFWDLPLRKGARRYYDNCLYFFCLLMLAGEYRVW